MNPSKKLNCGESSRLSLTTAGSSMNAALGGESAGGIGTPELDVTQSGGGPCAFVATQSGRQCRRRDAIEVLGSNAN